MKNNYHYCRITLNGNTIIVGIIEKILNFIKIVANKKCKTKTEKYANIVFTKAKNK